jgi:hypothetical protein
MDIPYGEPTLFDRGFHGMAEISKNYNPRTITGIIAMAVGTHQKLGDNDSGQ